MRSRSSSASWPTTCCSAFLFWAFASWSADHVSQKASTELAVLVAVLFMVLVGYHAEKARTALREAESASAAEAPPAV